MLISPTIYVASCIGFLLSAYSLYVHYKVKYDSSYQSVCDLNDKVSCTKAFTSGYGSIFLFPNGVWGCSFYMFVILLQYFSYFEYVYSVNIIAIIASAILAYLLYFRVKTICMVCHGVYAINIVLLVVSYLQIS